jgi:hypothetical protein
MRQGPVYAMQGTRYVDGHPYIPVPLELVEDFENCKLVNWIDRKQGCFSLIVVGHEDRPKI